MKVDDNRSPPCMEAESLLNLELVVSPGLASQLAQGLPVSTYGALDLENLHTYPSFMWVLGIQTPLLILAQKGLYQLSHLPSPHKLILIKENYRNDSCHGMM